MRYVLILWLAAAGCGASSGESKSDGTTAANQKSLYDRLGGKPAITQVVEDFVNNIGADARINTYWANADLAHTKAMLVEQICQASGGPCTYSGKDMKTAHTGMNIKDADFDALVEDLGKALDKNKVGEQEKKDLVGALGPMKGDIVGH